MGFYHKHNPFNPNKKNLRKIAERYQGNSAAISKHYNIANTTWHEYLKRDPEAKKLIDEVRDADKERMLDMAEFVVCFNMTNYKNNPAIAQRAAEKVIDKLGHRRNWEAPKESNVANEVQSAHDQWLADMELMRQASDSNIANNM